jgi:uncharacterized membrane protein
MTRIYFALSATITAAAFVLSGALYHRLPDQIPIHWNASGQVDGYGATSWAAFCIPTLMAGTFTLLLALPSLSPKHLSVDTFRSTYSFIALAIVSLLGYVHVILLCSAVSGVVDLPRAFLAGVLIMVGLMGNVLGKVRRNYWIGVRTPWTLANERVWNDTHRQAARVFVLVAALGLATLMLPVSFLAASISVFFLIIGGVTAPAIYSFIYFKRLERRGDN